MSDERTAGARDPLNDTIKRAKQELEHMIDLNPHSMMLVNSDGIIARANIVLLELLGRKSFSGILGKHLAELFPCPEPVFFATLLKTGTEQTTRETTVTLPGATAARLRFTAVPSSSKSGMFVVICEDISKESESARNLEKRHKKEAVEALAGAILHNVNQPLTVILVRTHLMRLALEKGECNSAEVMKNLQDIVKLTVQIGDIIKLLEKPRDFIVESYAKNVEILDINRSGDPANKWEAFPRTSVKTILTMLDTHEPGAATHASHTSLYAVAIAEAMGYENDVRQSIRNAAFFHDIGKLGIPDNVLQKPTILSFEEKEIIRRHSELGYMLLRNIPMMELEAETAYCHHEHFDGSGYPRGLSGEQIPAVARIVAVADAFDAMHFKRSYHEPVSADTVIEEICRGSGTYFDPAVVNAFKKCCSGKESVFLREDPEV